MPTRHETDFLHEGEIEAQRRFHNGLTRDAAQLGALILDTLPPAWARFIECDCSFRGREFDASGRPYPLLRVLDERTLVFPDYRGNKLYNSLGNILVNPHVGLLFVDFQQRARARVNGQAEVVEDKDAFLDIWPLAHRYVRVTVAQAYPNCKARIPKMTLAPLTDAHLDA
jgi:hypothetical protein